MCNMLQWGSQSHDRTCKALHAESCRLQGAKAGHFDFPWTRKGKMRQAESMSSQETQGSLGHRISTASKRMEDEVSSSACTLCPMHVCCMLTTKEKNWLHRPVALKCPKASTAFSQTGCSKLGDLTLPRLKVKITFSLTGLLYLR